MRPGTAYDMPYKSGVLTLVLVDIRLAVNEVIFTSGGSRPKKGVLYRDSRGYYFVHKKQLVYLNYFNRPAPLQSTAMQKRRFFGIFPPSFRG